jgi:hypothetical protein
MTGKRFDLRNLASSGFMWGFVWLLTAQSTYAAFDRRPQGARAIGMGGAFVALADDPWAVSYNSGGLGFQTLREVSVFYSPQPWGLSELSLGAFAFVEPTSVGTVAISGNRFGFELYREFSGALSYAYNYRDLFSIGASVTYNSLSIKNYGSASAIGIDVGLVAIITTGLRWGFFATNLNAPTMGQGKEKLPQVYSTGLSYSPVDGLHLGVDLVKDVRYSQMIKGGFEYKLIDVVSLRGGVGNNPSNFSSGLGIHYSFFDFDYAMTRHQDLGLSHQFSVNIILQSRE